MCGLVGIAGDLNASHEKIMKDLLILDSLRGIDSTGVCYVSKHNDDVKIAKQIGNPFELFDQKSFDKASNGFQKVMIGHNRYATSGAISRSNAHPFDVGQLVGVHNGTIKNKGNLHNHMDFKVDSENLYHHIQEKGLPDMLDKADGAWALVWWNKQDKTVNFLRNKERPLFFSSSADAQGNTDGKTIFWASEAWMLIVALSRANIAHTKPEELEVNVHFSIPIENGGKLGKVVAKKAAPTFLDPYEQHWANAHQQRTQQTGTQGTQTTTTPTTSNVAVIGQPESGFDRFYLKRCNILFELLDEKTDEFGKKFIPCFDGKEPFKEIRLYPTYDASPLWGFIGGEVQGDIELWQPHKAIGKGHYTVKPSSVRCLVMPEHSGAAKEEEEWTSNHGITYTKSEFDKKWKSCGYCSSPLIFGDKNKASTSGECFCPDCCNHPEVKSFVKF